MSFSGMVKEELFRQIGSARHCKMAELAAMLCSCGKMEYFSGESKLKIQTENEDDTASKTGTHDKSA